MSNIYYVCGRATGRFAGSGTPYINNDKYASTNIAPPPPPPQPPLEAYFDEETETWEYRPVDEDDA